MCDERERLIGYVYDECDGDDRAEIDRHLETCGVCRDEIAGLRATRQDLLAWEVPDHGSVWRPFAPARLRPWYREVPAWAMAAAASLMFMIGVGGGVAANAVMRPAVPVPVAQVQPPLSADQVANEAAAVRAEMAALESRMVSAVRANNAQLAQHMSNGGFERVSMTNSDNLLSNQVQYVSQDLLRLSRQLKSLEERNAALNAQVAQLAQALASAGGPGR